jgi:hypothetical protein
MASDTDALQTRATTDHSVPSVRIRFTFELVHKGGCLAQPFQPLLGSEPVKLSMTVENPPACTLQVHARIPRGLISYVDSLGVLAHELDFRRRPVLGSRLYPVAIVNSSRSSRIVNFSSNGNAADSVSAPRLCLRQARRSCRDNEFSEGRLFKA